jgi:hypothetical protein
MRAHPRQEKLILHIKESTPRSRFQLTLKNIVTLGQSIYTESGIFAKFQFSTNLSYLLVSETTFSTFYGILREFWTVFMKMTWYLGD